MCTVGYERIQADFVVLMPRGQGLAMGLAAGRPDIGGAARTLAAHHKLECNVVELCFAISTCNIGAARHILSLLAPPGGVLGGAEQLAAFHGFM